MKEIKVRRYKDGDENEICEVVRKDVLTENINDYTKEEIYELIESHNEELIKRRAKEFHVYVLTDNEKIIGVGMIGPYWGSLTESSFFTIFRNPQYKGQGLGRKIIEVLESDEYYKRADRVEIPASITAVEFYKHFGYGFKKFGHIVDNEGIYRMEKYPKISKDNTDLNQYNMRQYVEECWGEWNEEAQKKYFEEFINTVYNDTWIIQLNGKDIGFYNGLNLEDGSYEIGNICIIPEFQGKGIGTQVLKDIMELHKEQDLHIQYFKQNPVGKLYKRLGFESNGETKFHYQMIKLKKINYRNKVV